MPEVRVPRRKDRAVVEERWIRELLHRSAVGVLAVAAEPAPHLNPNLFVFDAERAAVYVHSSAQGALPGVARGPVAGSFAVYTLGRILPADRAFEFSAEYASVIATGVVERVVDRDEETTVLRSFMAKYAPHLEYGRDYEGITPDDLARTAVHRLAIDSWGGKRNEAKPEGLEPYPYRAP